MRILHVISSIDRRSGGPSWALLGLARAQAKAGLDVSVVSTFWDGDDLSLGEILREAGIGISLIGPCRKPLMRHPDLRPILNKAIAGADVVHIHGMWEEIQYRAARLSRAAEKPYIFRPCGMLDPWSLSQGGLKKRAYLAARLKRCLDQAAVIHFTTAAEGRLAQPVGIRAKTVVVPNGITWEDYEDLPAVGSFREQHPGLGDDPFALFLGRLHPKKGFDILLPAFKKTAKGKLLIVGPGSDEYRKHLAEKVSEAGLAERVLFTEMLMGKGKLAAYVDAAVFVLPSYQENFGNTVIEALASGTDVIVSDRVNLCDALQEAGVGRVVKMETGALATELDESFEKEFRCPNAVKKRRQFVRENFEWNQIAAQWKTIYGRIVREN